MSFIIGEYMSRTYKARGYYIRIVKNSYYKKLIHIYGDDFGSKKGKRRILNKRIRNKQKRIDNKEIKQEINEI